MNRAFIFGHWILTLLCGPIILTLKSYLTNSNTKNVLGFLEVYPIMVIVGLIFSIPTYVLFFFVFELIKDKNIKTIYIKAFFIFIVVIGIWVTTNMISGTLWSDIAISYSLTSIALGLILKSNFISPLQS
ncbi:hypothetical protein AR687_00125 [Flavobacteriaceae bacterium CRH]|nr:hypothetical protein AR687_00125 [Flavobacteriaceae bacterium CRH]